MFIFSSPLLTMLARIKRLSSMFSPASNLIEESTDELPDSRTNITQKKQGFLTRTYQTLQFNVASGFVVNLKWNILLGWSPLSLFKF